MTWWQVLPAVCVAAALLFFPGFVLARGLGAKGFATFAFAPLASCGLVGVAGVVGGFTGIAWSIWLLIGVTILSTLAGWGVQRIFASRLSPVEPSAGHRLLTWITVPVVLFISAFVAAKKLLPAMGVPDSFAQVYDNVFHLNAIRHILETGNASSLNLGNMLTDSSGVGIYPSVWHSLCALIAQLTSVNVLIAENVLTVVVVAVVWPFSCIALVRGILGPKIVATAVTGILSVGFWVFPYQTIQWGPLFPNTLAYSILPAALLLVVCLLGLSKERMANNYTLITLLIVAVGAMFLTQPNGFGALLAFTVPMVAGVWIKSLVRSIRARSARRVMRTVAWGAGAAVAVVLIWTSLLLDYDDWQPTRTLAEAVNDVITGELLGVEATWLASSLAAVGLLTIAVRRRGWWIVACWAVAGSLYVIAAWAPTGPFRHILTGSWYQDPYRLAALVPLFTIVLAAAGADGIVRLAAWPTRKLLERTGALQERLTRNRSVVAVIGGVLGLTLVLVAFVPVSIAANQKGMDYIARQITKSWSFDPGWAVSLPEYELMKRLPTTVPAGAVIAVDPFNGGSLAFAVSGRQVTEYHLSPGPDEDLFLIAQGLDHAQPGSDICRMANEENIEYVLDFGSFYMLNFPAANEYPAFVEIGESPTLELIDQQDHAKLYQVVGC